MARISATDRWSGAGAGSAAGVLPFAATLLDRRLKQVVAKGPRKRHVSVKALHALRIAVKKLRYALEFSRACTTLNA